jgi:hypothetical protein
MKTLQKFFVASALTICVASLYSCQKETPLIANDGSHLFQRGDGPTSKLEDELVKDPDFINNFNLDQESLEILTKDTSEGVIPKTEEETELMLSEFNEKKEWISESPDNFAQFFNEHGLDGDRLANIVKQKIEAMKKVSTKFPELAKLDYSEFRTVILNTYSQLDGKFAPSNCAQDYRDGMDDCDAEFRSAVNWTCVGGIIGVFLETPVGAAATVYLGIGQANTSLENCQRRVVRAYRDCMGYPR